MSPQRHLECTKMTSNFICKRHCAPGLPELSQLHCVVEEIRSDGTAVAYIFKECKAKKSYYVTNLDKIGAAREDELLDAICDNSDLRVSCDDLIPKFAKLKNFYGLAKEIGFEAVGYHRLRVPTLECAQEKIKELGLAITLKGVPGISTNEDFLAEQLLDDDQNNIAIIVSQGVEFFHDMTVHVLSVVKRLVLHPEKTSTVATACWNSVLHTMACFRTAFSKKDFVELSEDRAAYVAFLAALYDLFTGTMTKGRVFEDLLQCFLSGTHPRENLCDCAQMTRKLLYHSFAHIYGCDGFIESLERARQDIKKVGTIDMCTERCD